MYGCNTANASKRIPARDIERRKRWLHLSKRELHPEHYQMTDIRFCKIHFEEDLQGLYFFSEHHNPFKQVKRR